MSPSTYQLASLIEQFRQFVSSSTGLQQTGDFNSQRAVEPLPILYRQAKKLDSELAALNLAKRTELDRQRRRLIRDQDTHSHIPSANNLLIAQDRTPAERQVGRIPSPTNGAPL